MALTDPLKPKTTAGTEVECPRIATGDMNSEYLSADGLTKVTVSTIETANSRKRHLVRIDVSKLANNPTEESKKQYFTSSVYLVIDRPLAGYSVEEIVKLSEGLTGLLTKANLEKVIASQS